MKTNTPNRKLRVTKLTLRTLANVNGGGTIALTVDPVLKYSGGILSRCDEPSGYAVGCTP